MNHYWITNKQFEIREEKAQQVEFEHTGVFCEYALGKGYIISDVNGNTEAVDTFEQAKCKARHISTMRTVSND